MKAKHLLIVAAITSFTFTLNSCKKNNADSEEFETTFELSGDQAIADNLNEDANDVFMEAAADNDLMGTNIVAGTVESTNILGCATVTVTPPPPGGGFPKTILIDFGTAGCTSSNGITRKGKITVVLSDSVRKPGSTAVMTFDNYYVNGYKKEGTITWTNTSQPGGKSWQRKVENGKITAPDGRFWFHSGIKNVTQTAGVATPLNLLDDVFSITGNHTVTNAAGASREVTTPEALQKKTICENIDKGKLKIQGPNHYAIIDFGDGTCDRVATISIDGRPARTILLR
jgi:hypothetical protein